MSLSASRTPCTRLIRYSGYVSDLSASLARPPILSLTALAARTFPVSGSFTSPQADLYAAVLSVQKACIALCTEEGNYSVHDLYFHACRLLGAELARLGFTLKEREVERVLFPHSVSHSVGIGVLFILGVIHFLITLAQDLHEPHFDAASKYVSDMCCCCMLIHFKTEGWNGHHH